MSSVANAAPAHKAYRTDTIAAIATATGRGAIGIVRVSGPAVPDLCKNILGCVPKPHHTHYSLFADRISQRRIDRGIALFFPAPHSFTGEDVAEFHMHGNPVLLDLLMEILCRRGARPARPGEFSERAFLNGKIDLSQAEAIADLVDSGSRRAAESALNSLEGDFSRCIRQLIQKTDALRVEVEARIDFAEEDDVMQTENTLLLNSALEILRLLYSVQRSARRGSRLREGMQIAIVGAPNVGKSTLLNALAGRDSAIVSPHPGTTRDIVREEILLADSNLQIADTAGIRSGGDKIEQEGMRRARQCMEQADHLLIVREYSPTASTNPALLPGNPKQRTLIDNKCDLHPLEPERTHSGEDILIRLSAKNARGLDLLRQRIAELLPQDSGETGIFSARRRHLDALYRSRRVLIRGSADFRRSGALELLAESLRTTRQILGEIIHPPENEELLGQIFSRFCIGK